MSGLSQFSIKHPGWVITPAVLVTLAAAPGVFRLQLRTDGHALVPPDAPEIRTDRAVRDAFSVRDPVVILIRSNHPDGTFNAHTLELVQELTDEFREIPGIRPEDLFSLATEHGHRVYTGTLTFRRFLEPLPTTPDALRQLRDDLRAIRLYSGTLVSHDEQSTAIMLAVPSNTERTDLLRTLKKIIAAKGDIPETLHVIGAPVAEALLGTHLLEDLGVPASLLGYTTRGSDELPSWFWPRSLGQLRQLLGRHIGLVPITFALMAAVFLITFRSVTAAVLPLLEVGASIVFVFGLMGWLGVPIYLTIAVLPIILTAAGVADEIHVFDRYAQLLCDSPGVPHVQVLAQTMGELSSPMIKSALTTAMGFLSFAISPIRPVQAFGVFTAVGILFCMAWSLTVIPAMLALLPARWIRQPGGSLARRKSATGGQGFAGLMIRRRGWAIVLATLIAVAGVVGSLQVVIQDSWIDGFATSSEFRRATDLFNEQYLGTHLLVLGVGTEPRRLTGSVSAPSISNEAVLVPADVVNDPAVLVGNRIRLTLRSTDTPATGSRAAWPQKWESWIDAAEKKGDEIVATVSTSPGPPRMMLRLMGSETIDYEIVNQPLQTPDTLQRIAALEAFVDAQKKDAVGGVIGAADYVKTTYLMSRGLDEAFRRIPDHPERIEWLWTQYERIRGRERLRQIVDADYARSLVTVFLKNANFVDTGNLMRDIRAYEREHLTPHGIKIEFAGDVAVSQTLINSIVSTQTGSLLWSFLGSLAVTALLTRSLKWGLLCLVPCALAVVINFGVMGFVGMPLGVATSMFSAMVIGIGDDFAIHLVERYRAARATGMESMAALIDAVGVTGPAIILDALAVGVGFSVMILSQVPANARLGVLLVLSMASCLVGTLLLLPAMISFVDGRKRTSPTEARSLFAN